MRWNAPVSVPATVARATIRCDSAGPGVVQSTPMSGTPAERTSSASRSTQPGSSNVDGRSPGRSATGACRWSRSAGRLSSIGCLRRTDQGGGGASNGHRGTSDERELSTRGYAPVTRKYATAP